MKTLETFEFDRSGVSAGQLRTLAEGDYVTKAEPIFWSAKPERERRAWRPALRRGLPPAASGAVHHRDGADQRTRRGCARQSTQPRAGPMGTARPDLYDELG